ncbi:hypothetical protein BJ322DRAFT_990744, partial [Thelephora terrestris]
NQTKDLSWWPKVNTWEGSGLDFGCWTPLCERWFQGHLKKIQEGRTQPYATRQW